MRSALNMDQIYKIIQVDYGKEVADNMLKRYETYTEEKRKEKKRIPRRTALAGALAYIELIKRGEQVIYEEIAESLGEDPRYIAKISTKVSRECVEKIPSIPRSAFIKKLISVYGPKLELDEEEIKNAISLYESVEKDIERGYTFHSIAGACIYLAEKKDELPLEEISSKIGTTPISIRNSIGRIEDIRQKIKEEEKQESNLQSALKKVLNKLKKFSLKSS